RRIAEDRLFCSRVPAILVINSDSGAGLACAMFGRSTQKVSSRLTLVLCPLITMERLMTEDFIRAPQSPPYLSPAHSKLSRVFRSSVVGRSPCAVFYCLNKKFQIALKENLVRYWHKVGIPPFTRSARRRKQ